MYSNTGIYTWIGGKISGTTKLIVDFDCLVIGGEIRTFGVKYADVSYINDII